MDVLRASLLFASASVLAAALVPLTESPSVAKLKAYRTWTLVTPQPVDMTPAIALSCMGPSIVEQSPNPHAPCVFKVYVNSVGRAAMESKGKKPFPVGSMIVKEKFLRDPKGESWGPTKLAADAKPILLTAMVKREKGFDVKNGDWEYVALSGDASKAATKELEHCAKCHLTQKKTDFVFGDYGSIHHGLGK